MHNLLSKEHFNEYCKTESKRRYNKITGGSNEESMIPEIDQPKIHKPKTSLINRIRAYIVRLFT